MVVLRVKVTVYL